MSCQPCTPANDEFPIFCDPNPATDVGQRLLVEDEAFCTKALVSPETGSTLVWEDGIKWKEPTPEDTFNETTPFLAEGTTEPRNLVTRFADVVNVKDFGAVGDYTTDDTAAIQSAINSLPANGGTVYLPQGKYRTTSTITLDQNGISLIGDGDGGPSGTIGPTETLNNVAVVEPRGATQIIGDFVNGPVLRIKKNNVTVSRLSIDSTSSVAGGNAPISTGINGRKGGAGTDAHGILILADDVPGANTSRFLIEKVSVYNQPEDGIQAVGQISGSRMDICSVNCCNRHGISVQGSASIPGRVNLSRAGILQINLANISRNGGHGLAIGGLDEGGGNVAPYRIEINNLETSFNLITPSNAIDSLEPACCFISGENIIMMDCAIDGRTRFGNPLITTATYRSLFLRGRNFDIINFRSIDPNPYGIYIADGVSHATRGIRIQNFYISNASGSPISPNSYDPAIEVQSTNCRGIFVSQSQNLLQVPVNLLRKIAGCEYEETYRETTKTDRNWIFEDDGNNTGITSDFIYSDSYNGTLSPIEITINNNTAFYIQFDGPTRGFAYVSGNTLPRKSGIFHFRTGDASAGSEKIGGSATNVATTIGALTGTTGSIGDLTFSVDNALNRIYIENRTGGSGGYTFVFTNLNLGRKINSYSII